MNLPFRCALLLATLAWLPAAGAIEFKLTDGKGKPVTDAVVSLVPLDTEVKLTPPAAPLEIAQRDQEFSPYVTAIVAGTSVSFPNRDTVQHHVYSISKPKKFELPLYSPGKSDVIVFDRPGVVMVGCNIHDWMNAYIVILATPWFAQSDATGTATITGAPAGRYRAEVWHPRLGKTETREVILAGTAAPLAFTLALKPDRRIQRGSDRGGGGYK